MDNYCKICPRKCPSRKDKSYCGCFGKLKIARAALHFWEEPCISGHRGSGTVFFSGCNLKCVFCQNHQISLENYGKEISVERLAEIFLELQQQGAENINLVNPTHYIDEIISALDIVKDKLNIPVVYNSSGYELVSSLEKLKGYIDIYLPDLKYMDNDRALKYSNAGNYVEYATSAIKYMYKQVGNIQFDDRGMLKKGVIIRHLILPKGHNDSIKVLEWIADNFKKGEVLTSIMSQYTPCVETPYKELSRAIYTYEYRKVIDRAVDLSIEGFMQEKTSSNMCYIPCFDLEGV